jgi:hypothetical protein
MNKYEEAVIIWAVLSMAARMQRVLTYGDVEDFTGVVAIGQADPLKLIHDYCEKKHYPHLNSIAVSQETGFPGEKYPGNPNRPKLLEERAQIFTFNWAIKGVPRSKDFQAVEP